MRKRFQCRHAGLGSFCHRCAEAERLERLVQQNIRLETSKRQESRKKVWTFEEMKAEAKRLREG